MTSRGPLRPTAGGPSGRRATRAAAAGLLALAAAWPAAGCASPAAFGRADPLPSTSYDDTHLARPAGHQAPSPAAERSADEQAPFPDLMPRRTDEAGLSLRLEAVTPAIAVPGSTVSVRVSLTNTSARPLEASVGLRLGAPLVTRADLEREVDAEELSPVGSAVPLAALAPGATSAATVNVPAAQLPMTGAYGVWPLMAVATVGRRTSTVSSFLPFEQRKEYEPLSVSFVVPLTAEPDPRLSGADPAAREKAWAEATAPGGRLDRVLAGTAAAAGAERAVSYAIDPQLVGAQDVSSSAKAGAPTTGPATGPAGTPTGQATSTPSGAAPTPLPADPRADAPGRETDSAARRALAQRLSALGATHPLLALPPADPDVAALVRNGADERTLRGLLAGDDGLAAALGRRDLPRVAWPATALTRDERSRIVTAYGDARPAAFVVPRSASQQPGHTGDAARRFDDGTTALAYDEPLGRLLADTAVASSAGLSQRFLAETMTILQEFPGRQRRLLIAAPRTLDPDAATLSALLRTASTTPWVRLAGTDRFLADAALTGAAPATDPLADERPSDPFESGASPLSAERVGDIGEAVAQLSALAAVLPAGSPLPGTVRRSWTALASTRWRGSGADWPPAHDAADEQLRRLSGGVSVLPSSQVNFFAESGTFPVTVVNALDVEVHDVRLHLTPQGRSSRLRLPADPFVLTIAARSRTTVKVPAEAVAAGPVVVSAEVTTPDGTRLGAQNTPLTVQVQPTNGWLVLALGGAAGAVFLVGLLRTIRRNRPRVSAEDLKEINLE